MNLKRAQVKRIGELSGLELTSEELDELTEDIRMMLHLCNCLENLHFEVCSGEPLSDNHSVYMRLDQGARLNIGENVLKNREKVHGYMAVSRLQEMDSGNND